MKHTFHKHMCVLTPQNNDPVGTSPRVRAGSSPRQPGGRAGLLQPHPVLLLNFKNCPTREKNFFPSPTNINQNFDNILFKYT